MRRERLLVTWGFKRHPVNSPGVTPGQPRLFAHLLNAELLRSIASWRMKTKNGKKRVKTHLECVVYVTKINTCLYGHSVHLAQNGRTSDRHPPMSSAKPPNGSLQVPVTNCMRRRRTSLSTSFTNCTQTHESHARHDSDMTSCTMPDQLPLSDPENTDVQTVYKYNVIFNSLIMDKTQVK